VTPDQLKSRATQILAASRDKIAVKQRTVAVALARTRAGTFVNVVGAGAKHGLSPAQQASLHRFEVVARLPGADAEMAVQHYMAIRGWQPVLMGVSRNICSTCAFMTTQSGGALLSERAVMWLSP
jgi:hypothetical protein